MKCNGIVVVFLLVDGAAFVVFLGVVLVEVDVVVGCLDEDFLPAV